MMFYIFRVYSLANGHSNSEPSPNRHIKTKVSLLKGNGFNILYPESTSETEKTPAYALGFLLLSGLLLTA